MAPAGHKGRVAVMQSGLFSAGAQEAAGLEEDKDPKSAYVGFGSIGTHGAVNSELGSGHSLWSSHSRESHGHC